MPSYNPDLIARVLQFIQAERQGGAERASGGAGGYVQPRALPIQQPPVANEQLPPVQSQPYVMAEQLEQQAAPPPTRGGWAGLGEALARGVASSTHPGGYHGYALERQQLERQRQQDLLGRARELRGEGFQREQMNLGAFQQQRAYEAAQQQNRIENEQRTRQLDIAGRQQAGMGPQGTYYQTGPEAGKIITPAPQTPKTDMSLQPFEAWRQQNPNVPISEWVKLNRAPTQPREPDYEWIIRAGQPLQIRKGTAQPGDRPYDAVAERKTDAPPSSYAAERAKRTVQSVDELIAKVGPWTTGYGSLLANLPESQARNFAAELSTLKANIAFNELTAMREASKTGGALGQVSNIELNLLESVLGALDAGQSPANIKTQLEKIKASVERWQNEAMKAGAGNTPVNSNTGQGGGTSDAIRKRLNLPPREQ